MTRSVIRCPDCDNEVLPIGSIPATNVFAGRTLGGVLAGGILYRCHQCSLGFRWPRLSKDALDNLYTQGSDTAWSASTQSRRDWYMAHSWLEQCLAPLSEILDIGCFDGGFLEPLLPTHHCYGVEINASARNRAQQKGIEIIGSDFSALTGRFDCVTAFDVIEHVEQPKSFLAACLAAVRPGGSVLISTGNLDALTFRLMGSRYWYCAIAEHISFVSPAWFSGLAGPLNYRITKQTHVAHGSTSFLSQIRHATFNLLYRVMPSAFHTLRKIRMGHKTASIYPELADYPPNWGSAQDHFVILLTKQ